MIDETVIEMLPVLVFIYVIYTGMAAVILEDEFMDATNHDGNSVIDRKDGEYGARRAIIALLYISLAGVVVTILIVAHVLKWFVGKG